MRYLVLILCLIPVGVLAANVPAPETIAANADLFQWFFGLAMVGLGFFLLRTLNTIDKNNERQWESIGKLTERLSNLEGQHQVNHRGRGDK